VVLTVLCQDHTELELHSSQIWHKNKKVQHFKLLEVSEPWGSALLSTGPEAMGFTPFVFSSVFVELILSQT
jgi:hypothetical protein